jgi:NADP-dependent 3-hydroxy acid dehydrogenase YdfG
MSGISGQVVIVTGASSGIGAATAERLAAAGAKVMLAARRGDRLREIVDRIRAAGGDASYCVTDVSQQAATQRLAAATLEAYGRIDVLVNDAGVMSISPLSERRVEDWDRMIDINLKGVLYAMAAVLPVMQKQKSGHLINVASTLAHVPRGGAAVYCATKAAVLSISEAFRQEIGPDIRTTVISPGAVTSELHAGVADPGVRAALAEAYQNALSGTTVAEAILYALLQPAGVGINEIVLRPTTQGA